MTLEALKIDASVSQGLFLGFTLLLLYINDHTPVIEYRCTSKNVEGSYSNLTQVAQWRKNWVVKFNRAKTKTSNIPPPQPNFQLS